MMEKTTIALVVLLGVFLGIPLSMAGELPPDSEYVVAKDDGDLYVGDTRVRFWGGIGGFPPKPPKEGNDPYLHNQYMLERLKAYGFNMHRIWGYKRAMNNDPDYKKGDGSGIDRFDQMIALCKENGIRLWVGGAGDGGDTTPDDVDVIDDPATADAWAEAIGSMAKTSWRSKTPVVRVGHCVAVAWDPRLEAIMIRNNQRLLDHVNQHTGLRFGDDPVVAVWELVNEQWWIVKMVSGQWQKLPDLFKDSLLAKWHEFLKTKYGTEEALVARWGDLKPGESLEKGTIYLAPLRGKADPAKLNDSNPHASAKFEGEDVKYGREDFSAHRGRDVNEFFASLIVSHKQRVAEAFKKGGKSTKLSPLLWDTGIGYNGISQLLHQNADAVTHCAYIGGWTHDETHGRYPWYSGLEEPPRICLNVPWLEHNTVEGKPYFVYETQIGSPAKYRAEFPYRMLFLAAINGWDAVCWHTMSGGYDWNNENPLRGTLSQPGHAAAQFNYPRDEMQLSAMRAAGEMLKHGYLQPAKNPTTFIYGRKTLYHPDSMDYAGSYGKNGLDMMNTAYRYGSRIWIDLDRDDDEIVGPTVPLKGYAYPNPLTPTPEMTYNWNKGYLTFDTPGGTAFVGFLSGYGKESVAFENGVTISNVSLVSDPGMTYPVTPEEKFVAIGVISTDGKPLADCSEAVISAVSTSHNTGLKVGPDPKVVRPRHAWDAMKVLDNGKLPVLHTRVGCTITSPHLAGMTYTLRDWEWTVIGEGQVEADGAIAVPADKPVFLVELKR